MGTASTHNAPDPADPTPGWRRRPGQLVAGLALLFFLLQLAWFTYPNEYTASLVTLLDLDPFRSMTRPLWHVLVSGFLRLPGVNASVAAALFNALCGAATVGLMYDLAFRLRLRRSKSRTRQAQYDQETAPSRRWAGLVAAGYTAVSIPLLIVSTRPHPLALTGLLFVLAWWLAQHYQRRPQLRTWLIFCAVYGLGSAESPTFLLAAPVFALGWLWLFLRSHTLRIRPVLAGLVLFVMAYASVLIFCWSYYRSPVAEWRGFTTFGSVLHQFFFEQVHSFTSSVPRLGWITTFLLMIAPAVTLFRSPRDEVEDFSPHRGLIFARALLAALALVPLFDLVGSPWRLTGPTGLLVTPYLITALWFGRLVSLVHWQLGQLPRSRRGTPARLTTAGRPVLLVLVGLALAAAGGKHAIMANVRHAQPIVAFADRMLDSLGTRRWLVTDGSFDALLKLRARETGRTVHLLNRRLGRSPPYLRFLADQLPEARRRSVINAGLQPMLEVWFTEKDPAPDLAVQDYPELWLAHGYHLQPEGLLFTGTRTRTTDDPGPLFTRAMAVLAPFTNQFAAGLEVPPVEARYYRRAARQLSMLANNLGVLMEDAARPAEAWSAYTLALQFDTNNVSTLYNLQAAAQRMERPDRDGWSELIRRAHRHRHLTPAQMVADYGFIRNPTLYAQQGLGWATAGKTDAAAERIRQALALVPTNTSLQLVLARVLQSGHAPQASAQVYEEILHREPDNFSARAQLARLYLGQGRLAAAEPLFETLRQQGDAQDFAEERALLLVARGERAPARAVLEQAVRENRNRASAWLALALMGLEDQDARLTETAVAALERLNDYAPGQLFLADQALAKPDPEAARRYLERAARLDRGDPSALERWVTLEYIEGHLPEAAQRAASLLNLDSENATAHYILGMIHYHDGKHGLAEASLQRSLRTRVTAPACHGLAWLRLEQDRASDALGYARQAVYLHPGQAAYWGTLGLVLSRLGQTREAAASFDQALNRGLRNGEALVAAAEAFQAAGETNKVAKLVPYLDRNSAGLSAAAATRLPALRAVLQSTTNSPPTK